VFILAGGSKGHIPADIRPDYGKEAVLARNKRVVRNRRKREPNRRALAVAVIMLVIVIVGVLLLLEKIRVPVPASLTAPDSDRIQKIPPRIVTSDSSMEDYSSVVLPGPGAQPVIKHFKPGHGAVAIIVDDMGNSKHEAELLLDIGVPITFAIIPGLANVREVAESAHRQGREVMVHIPMEPKGVQEKPFEKNGLLLDMEDENIKKRLREFIDSVPYAVGANNHMGSRFTEDRAKMRVVLGLLKEKRMFFIDSKTTPASVGDGLAREMGIPTASRTVFLDNEADIGAIKTQIEKLADIAKKSGGAIGICHPHKSTIQALSMTLPVLKSEGITLVYASGLVK
jgi:polysaccharide deacetylase 2 family uncharacterized protein YibQ